MPCQLLRADYYALSNAPLADTLVAFLGSVTAVLKLVI